MLSFRYSSAQPDFHIRWCSFRATLTRRVTQVGQQLLIHQRDRRLSPVFVSVHVAQYLVFREVLSPLSVFFSCLSIALFVLRLRYSYYPFGIVTLFFLKICQKRNVACCCILTIDRDAVVCVGVWMRAFLTNLITKSNLSSTIIKIYVSKTSNIHIIFRNLIYIFFISVQLQ